MATATTIEHKPEAPAEPRQVQIDPEKRIPCAAVDVAYLIDLLDPLRKQLAEQALEAALAAGAKYADGNLAVGTVAVSGAGSTIDAERFVKLCMRREIPIVQIAQALNVNKTAAAELLSGEDLAAISDPLPPRAPSFKVAVRPGDPPPAIVDALQRVSNFIAANPELGKPAAKKRRGA